MRGFILGLVMTGLLLELLPAQSITNQPASQTVWAGATVPLAVGVSGSGPFTYQWRLNSTNLPANIITTVAGGGIGDDHAATNANLWTPSGVAVDAAGNVFIADEQNNRVRKVDTNGVITTVAGNGLNVVIRSAIQPAGGADAKGGAANSSGGVLGINASLNDVVDVIIDAKGNLLIADSSDNRICKLDTNGILTTIAGNGTATYAGDGGAATNASLNDPTRLALDAAGNLFIADSFNNVIRRVGTDGIITTVAGTNSYGFSGDGGAATNAIFNTPVGVAVDAKGNLFIADEGNQRIRKVDTSGIITTFAGNGAYGFSGDGGAATNAKIWNPAGLMIDAAGNLLIADESNNRIRRVGTNGIITTVVGTNASGYFGDGGVATNAGLNSPMAETMDAHGNLFIADGFNNLIRKVNAAQIVTTIAGNGSSSYSGDGGRAFVAGLGVLQGITADTAGNVYVAGNARIRKFGTNGLINTYAGGGNSGYSGDNGPATNASLSYATGLAMDSANNLYIADELNNRVRKVAANGIITTIAGTNTAGFAGDGGAATNALLSGPTAVAVDAAGDVFIADASNQRVRKINSKGIISTVAGNGALGIYLIGTFSGDGGAATNAGLSNPSAVAVDTTGNLFIADTFNRRIRKVDTSGIITTLAGNGTYVFSGDGGVATNAGLLLPYGVAVDAADNVLIADSNNNRIRKVDTNDIITTFAGNGTEAFAGDGGAATNASLAGPIAMAVDAAGNIFIADSDNVRVRKINNVPAKPSFSLAGVTAVDAGDYQVVVTGAGGSVTSSVASLDVVTAPWVYGVQHNANGGIALNFVSEPDSTNFTQLATNLVPPYIWLSLATNVAAPNGDWQFTDTNTAKYHAKFYRSLKRSQP